MGKSTISTGSFSIAMLVYQRVMNSVYKPLSSLFYLFLVENPYNMNNEKKTGFPMRCPWLFMANLCKHSLMVG
jgi:hypothetical protein